MSLEMLSELSPNRYHSWMSPCPGAGDHSTHATSISRSISAPFHSSTARQMHQHLLITSPYPQLTWLSPTPQFPSVSLSMNRLSCYGLCRRWGVRMSRERDKPPFARRHWADMSAQERRGIVRKRIDVCAVVKNHQQLIVDL